MENVQMIRRSFLTCGICDNTLENPKQLPCLHNFCEKCLREWADTECKHGRIFPCPICRHECGPREADDIGDINDWVSSLNINHFIVGLTKVVAVENSGQECDVCLTQKRSSPAASWCVECEQKLCQQCRLTHSGFTTTRTHQSISLADDMALRATLKNKEVHCPKHKTETIKLVCDDCDNTMCTVCSIVEHRKCKNIISIAETVSPFKRDNGLSFLKPLGEQRQAVMAFANDISKRQDWLNASISDIRNNISKTRQEYIETILRAEHDMIAELEYVQKIQSHNISESLEEAIALKNMCDTTSDMIQETLNYGSDLDIWTASHGVSFQVFLIGKRLVNALKVFDSATFTISITACSGIQDHADKLFGRIKVDNMSQRNENSHRLTSSRSGTQSTSRRVTRIDVRTVYP